MIEEIGKGLYLVHGANQGRFPWSHSIVAAGDSAVLFDTGCGADAVMEAEEYFSIDLVVNSHTHPDHFAGNHLLPGRDLLVPSMFAGIIADMDEMSMRLAGGGAAAEEWKALVRETLGHEPTEPTRAYDEGYLIEVGRMKFRAIHTPGHLADHFCFIEENSGVLLAFDIDLTSFGPWYGHDECDLDDFCASLRKILKLRPEMIVSSHRPPITHDIPDEIAAFDAIFRERNEKILRMLNDATFKPEALADLSPIYGLERHTSALFHYFESRMIEKHLELLERRGLAIRESKGAFRRAG
jgi:glyoxylase-like metal-dependent hydrolase (beta-lactamase superfamily II)